jgi:18S rRNA (adenine1779-N6/adenine1780-N6)-dimethyltransferase
MPRVWTPKLRNPAVTGVGCRPPPKVDSSVVRIEPRKPCASINFLEWDGLIRLCFSRKNKTLGAIFRQASTLALLHSNFQLCQALSKPGGQQQHASMAAKAANGSVPHSMGMDDDVDMSDGEGEGEGEDDFMDIDNASPKQVRVL